ncbi:MAG: hypothetical protein GY842_06845 [bacterium]|nr:hypothetical protein [bacterium]
MFSSWIADGSPTTWALLLEIVFAGAIVVAAGARLTRLADRLAADLKLGSALVGMLLLATVTSLPEVVAGCTAVWIHNTGMAFAAIYGSCSFNIMIIVLVNAIIGGGSVLSGAHATHRLTSALSTVLISTSLIALLLVEKFSGNASMARAVEWGCVTIILLTYAGGLFLVQRFDSPSNGSAEEASARVMPPAGVFVAIAVLSVILVGAAWWLAQVGDVLSDHPIDLIGGRKLGATFVGAAFLAVATSLPEIVTSYSAVKLGNINLALGNIFGSNMFNIFVVPFLKIVSVARGDDLLMHGADFDLPPAAIAGLLPLVLTGIAMAGLTYSTRRRFFRFGIDSVLIAVVYALGMFLLLA